jgi:hypothetical protein
MPAPDAAWAKIPAVNILRRMRARSWVLPLLLASLAARALMPAGFMASPEGHSLKVSMCSVVPGQRETIEIPGTQVHPSCDYCLSPLLGVLPAVRAPDFFAPRPDSVDAAVVSQVPARLLARSQVPRAPPRA